MHELSIALSILDIVAEESARLGGVPGVVHVEVGPLSGVVKAALCAAFDLAREESGFANLELIVKETEVAAWCEACDDERPIVSIQDFTCRECGAPVSRIIRGEELHVTGLEIET